MRAGIAALVVVAAILGPSGAAQAVPGDHVVIGWAQLEADHWLGIAAQTAQDGIVAGRAWLSSTTPALPDEEITLDCLEVSWWMPVYPIPPYLPFHAVEASGTGSDGARYWITAYDVIPEPAGFGDYALVSTEPGTGACGAVQELGSPVIAGEIRVLP